jgi:hypothetical protein
VSKNNKGMVCVLTSCESQDLQNGIRPDCRNHRHISRRRAFEHTGDVRFADRTLARVVDAKNQLAGFIVEVAGKARWATDYGPNWTWRGATFHRKCWVTLNALLKDFQILLDARKPIPDCVQLEWSGIRVRLPNRDAAISEALRNHSPCSITAKESELNADAALRVKRAQLRRSKQNPTRKTDPSA